MPIPVCVAPPAVDPVSLAEVKKHLRIEHSEEDTLIPAYISAAVSHLDGWSGVLGRCLVTQDWEERFERFGGVFRLVLGPVAEIVSIIVHSIDGATRTLAPETYVLRVDALGAFVAPAGGTGWVTSSGDDSIVIRYRCGTEAAKVPAAIRGAILLMVGDLYRYRETVALGPSSSIAMAADVAAMLAPYRLVLI